MKNVAVLTEDGAFALFFRPHREGFDSSNQKNANAREAARGGVGEWGVGPAGNWLMHKTLDVIM